MRASVLAVPVVSLAAGLLIGGFLGSGSGDLPPLPEEVESASPGAERPEPRVEPVSSPPKAPAPAVSRGDGRIDGRVVSPDGAPVQGVVVIAYRDRPRDQPYWISTPHRVSSRGPPDLDRDLARSLAECEAKSRYRAASRREAVSGRDGSFVLDGLSDGYQQIDGFREGFAVWSADDASGADPGQSVILLAERLVRLPVRVLGPDGTPPARAIISLRDRSRRSSGWTPEHPVLEVHPGTVRLKAEVAGERLRGEEVEVEIDASSPPEPVVLEFFVVRKLEVTVTFPKGVATAFHDVVVLELPDGADPSPERLLEEGMKKSLFGRRPRACTFVNMDPGRYLVGVVRRSEAVLRSRVVTIGDSSAMVDLVVPDTGTRPEGILVRVLAPDGTPEPFVELNVRLRTPRGGERLLANPERVEPGVFRVYPQEIGSEETLVIDVRSEDFGRIEVEFDPTSDGEVTIRLEEPATLRVVIPDYAGSRYEGKARLCFHRPGKGYRPMGVMQSVLEPDGTQEFGPFPPGEWEVSLWFGTGSSPLVRRPVTLSSGLQEVVLDLPRLFHLAVRLDAGDDGKSFYLRRLDGPSGHGFAERTEAGMVRFDALVAGEYVLSRHRGPREHMPLTITGDRVVRFRPIVINALRIEIADPEGTLARSGFRDGDLVLAIDDTEITSERQGWALLRVAEMKGEPSVFTVRRAGKRVEVVAEPKGVHDRTRSGGEVRPWCR